MTPQPDDLKGLLKSTDLIEALQAYRKKLVAAGQPLKAAAVTHCIVIVKRLAK